MTVVFKLGGSLLTLPDLADRLCDAVAQRADKRCLVLTGGGATADVVRDWSRIHRLNDESAHWLAIASLDLNRSLLETLLNWPSVRTREEAHTHWIDERSPLQLDFNEFVTLEEANPGEPLPHNWDVTSDSLAAWTALRWPVDELVLLKSVSVPQGMTAQQASDELLVDPYFPLLANRLQRISWCNLRSPRIVIETWLTESKPHHFETA